MKKFSFRLESVLKYKNSVLDNLQNEHAIIIQKVLQQENILEKTKEEYNNILQEFELEKQKGIIITKILTFEMYIKAINKKLEAQKAALEAFRREEENKRLEVIAAKQDAEAITKLKEKKIAEYKKEQEQAQAIIVEEFISNKMAKG